MGAILYCSSALLSDPHYIAMDQLLETLQWYNVLLDILQCSVAYVCALGQVQCSSVFLLHFWITLSCALSIVNSAVCGCELCTVNCAVCGCGLTGAFWW